MFFWWKCLLYVLFIQICHSARILGIFFVPSYSHQIVFQAIYKELSIRGHEVIVLTPNPINDASLTNLTEIDFSYTYRNSLEAMELDPNDPVKMRMWAEQFANKILIQIFEDERFKNIYQDPSQKFDLVLVEGFSSFYQVFGHKFNAPEIPVFSLEASFDIYSLIGNPVHPSIYGTTLLEFEYPISIWQKLKNSYFLLWLKWQNTFRFRQEAETIVKKYFGEDFPPISLLEKNLSIVFMNKNKYMGPVKPTVPSVIQFEFMHIKPPKPLPQDIAEILNKSTQGAVYFSLGTNVRSSSLPPSIINSIVKGLSALPYTVLWKWETDEVPGVGKNVITRKWFPQQDVLAHPNVKVFVTQGGLQSIEEAISTVVPMVGIPVIADQLSNVNRLVKLGVAVHLSLKEISKESLQEAITEVAENAAFSKELKKIRELSFDQPMTGLEKAIWWSEYVIRHKGAPHLRSVIADVPLYEYLMLDVIATVFGISIVLIFVLVKLFKILNSIFSKSNNKNKLPKKFL